MSLLLTENQILSSLPVKAKGPPTIRRQHCRRCRKVLAMEITTRFGSDSGTEYYRVKDALMSCGEVLLLYAKEKWFGQAVTCPNCKLTGKFPLDQPLNWELMEQRRALAKAGS